MSSAHPVKPASILERRRLDIDDPPAERRRIAIDRHTNFGRQTLDRGWCIDAERLHRERRRPARLVTGNVGVTERGHKKKVGAESMRLGDDEVAVTIADQRVKFAKRAAGDLEIEIVKEIPPGEMILCRQIMIKPDGEDRKSVV